MYLRVCAVDAGRPKSRANLANGGADKEAAAAAAAKEEEDIAQQLGCGSVAAVRV